MSKYKICVDTSYEGKPVFDTNMSSYEKSRKIHSFAEIKFERIY